MAGHSKLTAEQIQELLDGCTGEMAYRLFLEHNPDFGNVFEQARQMVAWGVPPEEIVKRVMYGLSPENKQYAQEHPYVKELLIRATKYAATRLDDKLHTAPLN